MIDFLNRLFGRQTSGATAKERLRLVLMSDHLSLAPEMIESMKRDLVDVISRYVEVDREKIDVHFEHQDKALAMLANIPITGVNRTGSDGSEGGGGETAEGAKEHEEQREPAQANASVRQAEGRPAGQPAAQTGGGQRRRKRRKSGQHNGAAPQSGSPAPAT